MLYCCRSHNQIKHIIWACCDGTTAWLQTNNYRFQLHDIIDLWPTDFPSDSTDILPLLEIFMNLWAFCELKPAKVQEPQVLCNVYIGKVYTSTMQRWQIIHDNVMLFTNIVRNVNFRSLSRTKQLNSITILYGFDSNTNS